MRFPWFLLWFLLPLFVVSINACKDAPNTERVENSDDPNLMPEEQLPPRVEQEHVTEPFRGSYRAYTVSIVRIDGCEYVVAMHNEGLGIIHHEMCDNPEHINLENERP